MNKRADGFTNQSSPSAPDSGGYRLMGIDLPLERLAEYLDGRESFKVELKWDFRIDRVSRSGRTEPDNERRKGFAKDVAALANSPAEAGDQRGFILLGIKDRKDRGQEDTSPLPFPSFDSLHETDTFGGKLQRIISNYLDPPPARTKPAPASLAAFVSLDESERQAVV